MKAAAFAMAIWIVGFVWGSIVFMTPSLKSTPQIPHISSNPAISFPVLLVWIPLTYFLARAYLSRTIAPGREGLRLGVLFSVMNFLLDLIVLVMLLRAGFGYFASLTVWLAYFLLLIIPWLTGRSLHKAVA